MVYELPHLHQHMAGGVGEQLLALGQLVNVPANAANIWQQHVTLLTIDRGLDAVLGTDMFEDVFGSERTSLDVAKVSKGKYSVKASCL